MKNLKAANIILLFMTMLMTLFLVNNIYAETDVQKPGTKAEVEAKIKKLVTDYHADDEYWSTMDNLAYPDYYAKDEGYYLDNIQPMSWLSDNSCIAHVWLTLSYQQDLYSEFFYLDTNGFKIDKKEKTKNIILKYAGTYSYKTSSTQIREIPKFILIGIYE